MLHGYVFRDLARSNAALARKYEWLKQNVFGGWEYATGNQNYAAFPEPAENRPNNVIDYSRNDPEFVWDYRVRLPGDAWFLRSAGPAANPATLLLEESAPIASAEKYRDSGVVLFGAANPWKEVGTWTSMLHSAFPSGYADVRAWIGLKNGDDTGTRFDLRAEVYKNGSLLASGETLCISGVSRNPATAKEVTIALDAYPPASFGESDTLSLKVLTRIGTNPDGSRCPGHTGAAGVRLYFDSTSRPSTLE